MKTPFSFVVLRYMHDVFTREFVNVGVLFFAPRAGFLKLRRVPRLDRIKGMFPGLASTPLRELLEFLEERCEKVKDRHLEGLERDTLSADAIAKSLLTTDDSALQWSSAGGGTTADPEKSLAELFERLVTRHEKAHPAVRREDADVWKPFHAEFEHRKVLSAFAEKTLTVRHLHHKFEASWQPRGGHLRLFKPLSFDLVEPSKIVDKAAHWSGLLRQFRKAEPDFFMYFLVGGPTNRDHQSAYDQARETLEEDGGGRKKLVAEEDASTFAEEMSSEIQAVSN